MESDDDDFRGDEDSSDDDQSQGSVTPALGATQSAARAAAAAADAEDAVARSAHQTPFASLPDLLVHMNADTPSFIVTGLIRWANQLRQEATTGQSAVGAQPDTPLILHAYLQSSPACAELFALLGQSDQDYTLLWRLAEVLALLLSQAQSTRWQPLAVSACQKVLTPRMFARPQITIDSPHVSPVNRLFVCTCDPFMCC